MNWSDEPFEDDAFTKKPRGHYPIVLFFLLLVWIFFAFGVYISLATMLLTPEQRAEIVKDANVRVIPEWAPPIHAFCCAFNLLWIAAICFWRRIGFYGLVLTCAAITVVNFLCEMEPRSFALLPMMLVVMIYLALQVGGPRSTWAQMH